MDLNNFEDAIVIDLIPNPNASVKTFEWKTVKVQLDNTVSSVTKIETNGKKYIPKAKDKLYFFPGCDVPRFKARDWASKKDISITIKPENATAMFGSPTSSLRCLSYDKMLRVKRQTAITWLEANYDLEEGNVKNIHQDISESTSIYVYLCNNYCGYRGKYLTEMYENDGITRNKASVDAGFKLGLRDIQSNIPHYTHVTYVKDTAWRNLTLLASKADVYDQSTIISLINENAPIIDTTMYENLRNMFNSQSKADNVLALEVLSNCNLHPSLHHVILLIQEFHNKIYNMQESKHVNFKSLLEFVGLNRNSMHITEDRMMECLMDKEMLTLQTVAELAEGVKARWKDKYDSEHFKIFKITVSDEVKEYFARQQEEELQTT